MVRKVFLMFLIFTIISCGKDVVTIEDPTPPIETDEIFEVNIVGFTTDQERSYILNGGLSIDGTKVISNEFGFFHFEKILIGKKGKIVQFDKEGFIPTFYRIANNQSLEEVILNLQLIKEPKIESIGELGGSLVGGQGVLTIDENVLNEETDIIFKSFVGKQASNGNLDPLYFSTETEYLLKEASLYIDGTTPITEGSFLNVQLNTSDFQNNEISDLSILKFDELTLSWKEKDIPLEKSGDVISFSIPEYGWWTIARKVPAQYATLNFKQMDGLQVVEAEVNLSIVESDFNFSTYYTSSIGNISTFFPLDVSIYASMNNGQIDGEFSTGFSEGVTSGSIEIENDIQFSFEGNVYACDFTSPDGFVTIISEGQHKVKEIKNGLFNSETFENGENVRLQFYSENFEFLNDKMVDIEDLKSEENNFLSCSDLNDNLIVLNGTILFQDFNMCRVKLRPKETVVIGEKGDGDFFLVSYSGNEEGIYDGLIYYPLITDEEVKVDVKVKIIHHDEVENKVGGIIKTEYISSGETLTISFIGDID